MHRCLKLFSFIILFLLCAEVVYADDLMTVYRLALINDPAFSAAKSKRDSTRETLSQARSGLLPTITSQNSSTVHSKVDTTTKIAGATTTGSNSDDFRTYGVSLSQTLFNWGVFMTVKQAKAIVKQADAEYAAAIQDLMTRVAKAYFDVLLTKDNLEYTRAEKRANKRQYDQAEQRYKVGLDAITSVYDAKAAYDAVVSREITAQNDLANSLEALRAITGTLHKALSPLKENLALPYPKPRRREAWVTMGLKFNNQLKASAYSADAAQTNININRAGYIPALNLTASYNDNRQPFGTGITDTKTQNVGLELDVPIFQGGSVISKTRQAKYDYATALSELDAVRKSVVSSIRQNYNSVISGISAVKADRQAIISAQSAVESSEAAFRVGTRTIVDVLDRQRDLYDAQRTYSSDQYTYINDLLKLKENSGKLTAKDLEDVNKWLNHKKLFIPSKDIQQYSRLPRSLRKKAKMIAVTKPRKPLPVIAKAKLPAVKTTVKPAKHIKQPKIALKKKITSKPKAIPVKKIVNKKPRPIITATPYADIYLQVGAFEHKALANKLKMKLQKVLQQDIRIEQIASQHQLYLVQVGPIKEGSRVYNIQDKIKTAGLGDPIVVMR